MASQASEEPSEPFVVEIEAEDDQSLMTFRAFVENLLASPEPELESIGATNALRQIRTDAR